MDNLIRVREEVIARLEKKYGADLVEKVDAMGEDITNRVINGEEVLGITDEQRDLILDFAQWIVEHPLSGCTIPFIRPERVFN